MGVLTDFVALSIDLNIGSPLKVFYLVIVVFSVNGNPAISQQFFLLHGHLPEPIMTIGTLIFTIQQLLFVHWG